MDVASTSSELLWKLRRLGDRCGHEASRIRRLIGDAPTVLGDSVVDRGGLRSLSNYNCNFAIGGVVVGDGRVEGVEGVAGVASGFGSTSLLTLASSSSTCSGGCDAKA